MINARSFVISILGAVLTAASLTCANDLKPSEETVALQPPVIQELALQPRPVIAFSLRTDALSAPLINTPDLSRYREFQFGMNLLAVVKQMQPSKARVIHQRPAVIQELEWRPQRSLA